MLHRQIIPFYHFDGCCHSVLKYLYVHIAVFSIVQPLSDKSFHVFSATLLQRKAICHLNHCINKYLLCRLLSSHLYHKWHWSIPFCLLLKQQHWTPTLQFFQLSILLFSAAAVPVVRPGCLSFWHTSVKHFEWLSSENPYPNLITFPLLISAAVHYLFENNFLYIRHPPSTDFYRLHKKSERFHHRHIASHK